MAGSRLLFASNGALYASLLPWYPTLSDELSVNSSRFGLIVACCAVGSICSSALPPRLMRIGFLATSPVVGALADEVGLRWGLGILVASGVIVVAVCGYLEQHSGRFRP